MKTRKEWIDTLPADIRERAYKYQKQRYWMVCENSLQEAIMGAFFWRTTKEGGHFWSLVSRCKFEEARQLLQITPKKPIKRVLACLRKLIEIVKNTKP